MSIARPRNHGDGFVPARAAIRPPATVLRFRDLSGRGCESGQYQIRKSTQQAQTLFVGEVDNEV